MLLRLGELCGGLHDGLMRKLTVNAGLFWVSSACDLMIAASTLAAGMNDRINRLVRSEGAVQVLSMGVCSGCVMIERLNVLEALCGCSIAGSLGEQAGRALQKQREGAWVTPSSMQMDNVMLGRIHQLPGLMRGPFALEIDALVASLLSSTAPAPDAGAGSKGIVASVATLRAAFAAAKPILGGVIPFSMPAGQRPLHAVACCNVYCCRGGPTLVGGGDAWVGPSDQPFCSRACMAAHLEMCRAVQGATSVLV